MQRLSYEKRRPSFGRDCRVARRRRRDSSRGFAREDGAVAGAASMIALRECSASATGVWSGPRIERRERRWL